jgi:hypothetical protein
VRFVALRTLSAACDRSGSFLLTRMQETLSPTDPSVSLRCVAALPRMRWPAACPCAHCALPRASSTPMTMDARGAPRVGGRGQERIAGAAGDGQAG